MDEPMRITYKPEIMRYLLRVRTGLTFTGRVAYREREQHIIVAELHPMGGAYRTYAGADEMNTDISLILDAVASTGVKFGYSLSARLDTGRPVWEEHTVKVGDPVEEEAVIPAFGVCEVTLFVSFEDLKTPKSATIADALAVEGWCVKVIDPDR